MNKFMNHRPLNVVLGPDDDSEFLAELREYNARLEALYDLYSPWDENNDSSGEPVVEPVIPER